MEFVAQLEFLDVGKIFSVFQLRLKSTEAFYECDVMINCTDCCSKKMTTSAAAEMKFRVKIFLKDLYENFSLHGMHVCFRCLN